MKILILGSSGFIGRNLNRHLSIDHNVLSLDKFNVSQELNIDVESFSQVKKAISKSKPDVIINLAARTDLLGKKIEDYSVNWKGGENIIQAIEEIKIEPLLIHFSSMLVCQMGYTPQSMSEFKPDTIYGESKVKSERIFIDRKLNFPVFILRPTTVWGYDAEKPYSTFIKIVKSFGWLSLSVFDAKRDFCDIRVLVDLISKIISSKDRLHNSFMSSYYISDKERKSVNDLAKIISAEQGGKVYESKILDKWIMLVIRGLSYFGDFLLRFSIHFPLNSRRIKNMNTSTGLPVRDLHDFLRKIN